MPRLNHRALMCEFSKTKNNNNKKKNSVPVVEDEAKLEGVIL